MSSRPIWGTATEGANLFVTGFTAGQTSVNWTHKDGELPLAANLSDGGYTLTAYAQDADGNTSTVMRPFTFARFFAHVDADNTTLSGYPNAQNGDLGAVEMTAQATRAVRTFTNVFDSNNNGVPGFADGINKFGNGRANACWKFEPMVVDVPSTQVFPNAQWVFRYAASDPSAMTTQGTGASLRYVPAPGVLRLWKKDGDAVRSPLSAHEGGDFLRTGQAYTAAQLGLGTGNSFKLFIEAVNEEAVGENARVGVEFYPLGVGDATKVGTQDVSVEPYLLYSAANPSIESGNSNTEQ